MEVLWCSFLLYLKSLFSSFTCGKLSIMYMYVGDLFESTETWNVWLYIFDLASPRNSHVIEDFPYLVFAGEGLSI